MSMSNLKKTYIRSICRIYSVLLCCGEIFTTHMENSIKEVEYAAEMQRRGSVLKQTDVQKQSLFNRIFKI